MPASNWQGPQVRKRSERSCGREDAAAEPRLRGDIRTAHGVSRGYRRPADPSPVRGGIMLIARATVALCRPFRAQRIGDSYPRLTPWADISRPCRGSVSNGNGVATPRAVVPQFRVPQFRVPSLLFTCQRPVSAHATRSLHSPTTYHVCARKTVGWTTWPRGNARPGRRQRFFDFPADFPDSRAQMRAQTATTRKGFRGLTQLKGLKNKGAMAACLA